MAAGALPRVRIQQAEADLEDAKDEVILAHDLYGGLPDQGASEAASAEMVAAAQRRVDHARSTDGADRPALRHEPGEAFTCDPQQRADFEALGQAKAVALQQLPELREMLAIDVRAAYDGDPACKSLDKVIFCYPGLEAITVYRLAHLLHRWKCR